MQLFNFLATKLKEKYYSLQSKRKTIKKCKLSNYLNCKYLVGIQSMIKILKSNVGRTFITLGIPKGKFAIHLKSKSFGRYFRLKIIPNRTPMIFPS